MHKSPNDVDVGNHLTPMASAFSKLSEIGIQVVAQPSDDTGLHTSLAEVNPTKALIIARTLAYHAEFNDLVTREVSGSRISDRYTQITEDFDGILVDMQRLIGQAERGRPTFGERAGNIMMKIARGDVATRFDSIVSTFKDASNDSAAQIRRETGVLAAYLDYREAYKSAEGLCYEILEEASLAVQNAEAALQNATMLLEAANPGNPVSRIEKEQNHSLAAKNLDTAKRRERNVRQTAENLTVGFNLSDLMFKRLDQIIELKQAAVNEAKSFIWTNSMVFASLKINLTGLAGLHETVSSIDAMKRGRAKAIEYASGHNDTVMENATRSAYTSVDDGTVEAMRGLIRSTQTWQLKQKGLIEECVAKSAANAEAIRSEADAARRQMIAVGA